jgi:hypothetical protein
MFHGVVWWMLHCRLRVVWRMLHAQDDARVEMVQLQFQQLSSTVRASSLPLSILRTSPWSSPPLAFLPRTVTMLHTRPPARPQAHTPAHTWQHLSHACRARTAQMVACADANANRTCTDEHRRLRAPNAWQAWPERALPAHASVRGRWVVSSYGGLQRDRDDAYYSAQVLEVRLRKRGGENAGEQWRV